MSLLGLEAVLVPVNMLVPDHWGLIALDLRRKEAHYYDSWFKHSRMAAYMGRIEALLQWVGDETLACGGARGAGEGWTINTYSAEEGLPQQHNDYDCGACVFPLGGGAGGKKNRACGGSCLCVLAVPTHPAPTPTRTHARTHCPFAFAGVFMLFFARALLQGKPFVRQSELGYCRLRLALDLASTISSK